MSGRHAAMVEMVCGHGDRAPAPCGDDRWCLEPADHVTPHTGQEIRCKCGTRESESRKPGYRPPGPYEVARAKYLRTGESADLEAMLALVRADA